MRNLFLTFLLLGSITLSAQTGNYFLSHYASSENHFDNVCFGMVQDNSGMVYFATRSGIQQFDGRKWTLIKGSGAVYSLQLTDQNEVIWSGTSGFGKLQSAAGGERNFVKLSGNDTRDVFQSLVIHQRAYFLSEESVTVYDLKTKQSTLVKSTNLTGALTGIFELFGTPYLNTERGGIVKLETNRFTTSRLNFAKNEEVVFSSGSESNYLIGLSNNRIFLCSENLRIREIKLQDSTYAEASVIVSGSQVNKDLFVLGTLRGGLIFIQTATGKTQEIINYNTGLPDNEIYAMMIDKSQSIWAAHEYGFTRVSPYLPFRSFGHYPGLSGNLLCATSFSGNVYVGTSLGLFKLEKEDLYEEITYYIDQEIKTKPTTTSKPVVKKEPDPIVATPSAPTEAESKKRGFWRFLKKNKTTPAETKAESKPQADEGVTASVEEDTPANVVQYQKVKKTERVLRSSQFVYKKVAGINAKVTQLESLNNRLLAIGLGGVYEVMGVQSRPVLEEPVRMAYASASLKTLFISTYGDEIKAYQPTEKGWLSSNTLENLDDRISSVFEGKDRELWLLAMNKAYRLEVAAGKVTESQAVDIVNPNFDDVGGMRWGNEIIVTNTQGFFKYDRQKNTFVLIDSLPKPRHYYTAEGGVLFSDGHSWSMFGAAGKSNLQLLNLLHDLRFVTQDKDSDNLWVITNENELYKFFGERFTPYEGGYPLTLKSIRGEILNSKKENFELDQEKSGLSIEIVQPDYLAAQAIEYRYQLKGLDKSWSDWSTLNNSIDIAYLPSGEYTLVVQSRDIFGKTKEFDSVNLEVLPPYWRRPWFYALEFFVFAALVMLSFRLSTRFRIISRLLTLLTIIMLIQFIQTVIADMFNTKASPVMDFFVQVVVAFLILPVEGYLRNLMLRSLETKTGRLYHYLSLKPRRATDAEDQVP